MRRAGIARWWLEHHTEWASTRPDRGQVSSQS